MNVLRLLLPAMVAGSLLAACDGDPEVAALPPPQEPGAESIGYFCGMTVADHPGPKGQIFLEGRSEPLWFSSVRDVLAYTLLPEESQETAAIYVNDMAQVRDWQNPEPGTWMAARDAYYVVGSSARGGMGAMEIVPFSERAAAERFRDEHGGRVFGFEEVPEDYVLGAGDGPAAQLSERPAAGSAVQEGEGPGRDGGHDRH